MFSSFVHPHELIIARNYSWRRGVVFPDRYISLLHQDTPQRRAPRHPTGPDPSSPSSGMGPFQVPVVFGNGFVWFWTVRGVGLDQNQAELSRLHVNPHIQLRLTFSTSSNRRNAPPTSSPRISDIARETTIAEDLWSLGVIAARRREERRVTSHLAGVTPTWKFSRDGRDEGWRWLEKMWKKPFGKVGEG